MPSEQLPGKDRADAVPPELDSEASVVLLKKAQAGDGEALNVLWKRYLPPLLRWATGRLPSDCRDLLGTEDLVQETFLRTVRALESFEPRFEGAIHAYLRKALHHRIVDEIRRAREGGLGEGHEERSANVDPAPSPIEHAIGREALERYEAALAGLDAEDRELIIARVELGLSYDLVAKAVGKPTREAARAGVSRALVRLAKEMSHGSR